jgi:hypothetical protein
LGFHLAANSVVIDLNASSAKTEAEDDRRLRWDTPSSKPKVDWKSSISALKKTASALTEPAGSAPFRSSLFPASLLHAEADLRSKKLFKDEVLRTDAAGACGLSLVRCGKLAHATLGKESPVIIRMKDAATGVSPQDVDSLLAVLRDSLGELDSIRKEISKVLLLGSKIAAGIFNQEIEEQRRLVCDSPAAKAVKSTLKVCKPSLTHLFGDNDMRLDKVLEAAKFSFTNTSLLLTAPRLPFTSAPPAPRRDATRGRSPTKSPTSSLTSLGPREKTKALPPRRGRASRINKSFKGGKGGWSRA